MEAGSEKEDTESGSSAAGEEGDQEQQLPPAGELSAAGEEEDSNQASKGTNAATERLAQGKPMTREEALKMLQAVRDRDMLRRLRQERQERSRHIEVEKDW